MYPKNAASPPRIAVGAVVQISDGVVQTSGVSIAVVPQGGASAGGGGTTAYDNGIVLYTPTQAETNYAAFVVIAYKTGCIPVSQTIVTTASAVAGYAGLDWLLINAPTTTQGLSGTTVKTATDVETDTADIQSRLPSALVGGRIDANMGAISTDQTAADNAESFFDGTGYAGTNNVIPAVTNVTGAVGSVTGAVGSVTGNVGGNVVGSVGSVTGAVGSVGANGITATSIATDAINAATVKADAVTKIQTGLATPTNITAGTITTATNVTTVNGLAANVITAASVAADAGAEIADAVWDEAISGHLGAGSTGAALNAAGSAGDPWSTPLPGAYGTGTAGKIIGDNVNATISSRSSHSAADVVTALGTGTTLTAVPWNAAWDAEVQSEAADALVAYDPPTNTEMEARTLVAANYATAANQTTIAGYIDTEVAAILAAVDTEVAAIKAKTDNLPAAPASTGDAMTLTSAYDFAKGTVAMTEAYAADGATMTPAQALHMIWSLIAERSIASTTLTAKKLDGSTTSMTFTLDSATVPTTQTRST